MQYADGFFFLKQIYSSEALNCTTVQHFCGTNFQGPRESGFLTDLAAFFLKFFLALLHVVAALAGLMWVSDT